MLPPSPGRYPSDRPLLIPMRMRHNGRVDFPQIWGILEDTMALLTPQLGRSRGDPSIYRRFIKNRANRLDRRAGKRLMEDAPRKRRYRGYD